MSDDEAPSSPESDIFLPKGYEDIGSDMVVIPFGLPRSVSDDFEDSPAPPKKKARSNSKKEIKNQDPDNDHCGGSSSVVDGKCTPVTEVLDVSGELDSPEDIWAFVGRRGRRRTAQRRSTRTTRSRATKNKSNDTAKSSTSITLVEDSPSSTPTATPTKQPSASIFSDSISISDDDDAVMETTPVEEELNCQVILHVTWKQLKTYKFPVRKFQKLKEIFCHFAKLEGVPEDCIFLTSQDTVITPDDSPDSLKMGKLSFIEGGVMDKKKSARAVVPQAVDPNSLEFKIQQKGVKEKVLVRIGRTDKMAVLMSKVAEDMQLEQSSMKFMFDGEDLDPSDTPESLDLDGGECIDLIVK